MENSKLLIVGSFPKKTIYGGIQRSCKLILDSTHFSGFELILFDSSQISNPPPPFFIRLFLAVIRIYRYILIMVIERPQVSLIFCSDGASAIEKGVMLWLSKIFRVKALIFPRAGNLIEQTKTKPIFRNIIKFLFGKSNVFLAQGVNWNIFARGVIKLPQEKIKVVHNWTATENLLKIGATKKYNENNAITKFLFVGWLEKEKGLHELLESIKVLNEKNFNFSITFIGDGSGMKSAQKFITDNQLSKKVIFKGWVAHRSIEKYYKAADIFVLPSWAEGMPNALIEALSCGLASIVSNVGMISNYLVNDSNAILIPPKDSKSLSTAMEELILNKKLKISISKNGYKVANEYFSSEKELKSLSKLIKNVI